MSVEASSFYFLFFILSFLLSIPRSTHTAYVNKQIIIMIYNKCHLHEITLLAFKEVSHNKPIDTQGQQNIHVLRSAGYDGLAVIEPAMHNTKLYHIVVSCCSKTLKVNNIMLTRRCSLYPLAPRFCKVKLGFTGVYIFFLVFALKHRVCLLVEAALTSTHILCSTQR